LQQFNIVFNFTQDSDLTVNIRTALMNWPGTRRWNDPLIGTYTGRIS